MKETKLNAHSYAVPPPAMSPPPSLPVDKNQTAERLGFSRHETPVRSNAGLFRPLSKSQVPLLKLLVNATEAIRWGTNFPQQAFAREEKLREEMSQLKEKLKKAGARREKDLQPA